MTWFNEGRTAVLQVPDTKKQTSIRPFPGGWTFLMAGLAAAGWHQ
ncbi:hypothetical protein [Bhargavaea ullalensis]|uniref:Uncharacterized protein n=1 Tax=Bhargavaea ullalensis TaxID=1265685 RepID=A0ABV2GE80_9BACL